MRKALVVLTACMLVLGVSMAMARPSQDAQRFVIPPFASENPQLQTGNMNTFQAGDTFWWGPWDFETGGGCLHDNPAIPLGLPGDATSQFWTSQDETEQPAYFHRTDGSAVDPGPVLEGNYSMWCGWRLLCQNPPALFNSGYANAMQQQLYKTFEFGATPGNMVYLYYSDSEPGYDYTYLIATTVHDPITCGDVDGDTLVIYNGAVGYGMETVDLSAYANQTITLVFKFHSDGGWSDSDGLYSTGGIGAFTVDSIVIGGTLDADFETDMDGWDVCGFEGYGDYAGIYSVSNLDVQDPTCTCLDGCVLAFFNRGVFPEEHVPGQANIAISPTLDLTADPNWPRGNSIIQWGWYRDLPLAADNFAIWHVRYRPYEDDTCAFCDEWSAWFDENTVYYGPQPNCGVANFNVSGQVRGHAEYLQIAVGIQNQCLVWPWWCVQTGNQSPMFDNIRFGMHGARAPGMFMSDWDFFQDAFALDGTLDPRATGRIDSGTNIFPLTGGVQVHTVLGDSAVVNSGYACTSRLPQGLQNPDANMNLYFRVFPGECIDATAYAAWYGSFPTAGGWAYARMDTAMGVAPGAPTVEGVYMTRFHETDPHYTPVGDNDILPDFLFTPGTTIEYFFLSYWTATPAAFNVYPDTTGGFYQEVEILPDIMNPQINCDAEIGADDQNCMLYVDHWDRRGGQNVIERGFHALGLGPVVEDYNGWWSLQEWDRYDNEAPTSDQGGSLGGRVCQDVNHPLEGGVRANGPTLAQIVNYYTIMWGAGNQETVMFGYGGSGNCANDIALLQSWMDFPREDPVLFWLSATGPGVFMFVYGAANTAAFGGAYLGIDLVAASYRDYTGDYSDCPDVTGVVGAWNEGFHCGAEQSVQGACGQFQRNFNVLTTEATTQAAVGVLEYAVQVGAGEYAAVSHDATADTATVSLYKTVTDAFAVDYIRKYEPYCDSEVCVAWWEADVIGGPYYSYCFGNLQLVGEGEFTPRFANKLGNSYPNPMNPSARIDFSIKSSSRVTLRVFDVSGRLINTLVDKKMDAGNHFVVWDGTNSAGQKVASGIYFYQIDANGFKAAKKITVLK